MKRYTAYLRALLATTGFMLIAGCNEIPEPDIPGKGMNIKPVFDTEIPSSATKAGAAAESRTLEPLILDDGTQIDMSVTKDAEWPIAGPQDDTVLTKGTVYSGTGYESKKFRLSAWNATQSNAVLFSDKEYTCDSQHYWSTYYPPEWPMSSDDLAFVGVWDSSESATASIVSGKYAVSNWDVSGNYADQKDLRAAFATYPADHNSDVLLCFNPYMNAIRVKVGTIPEGYAVTKVSLTGVGVRGTLVFSDSYTPNPSAGGADSYVGDWQSVYTGSLSLTGNWKPGSSVTPDGTAFLIIDPDGDSLAGNMEVTFTDPGGVAETKSVALSDLVSDVSCGDSFTVTIGYDPTIYVIEIGAYGTGSMLYFSNSVQLTYRNTTDDLNRQYQVVSYSYPASNPDNKTSEPFKVDYTTHPGGPIAGLESLWSPFNADAIASTGIDAGLSVTANPGSTDWVVKSVCAAARRDTYDDYNWNNSGQRVTGMDLSYATIGGDGAGSVQNTANCYIVKQPGSYTFPCVYGNAIRNGMVNSAAYESSQPASLHVLGAMLNADGVAIHSPYVLQDIAATDAKAALLWCDTRKNGELLIKNVELVGSGSGAYISFETASLENMGTGNAVIALYDDGRVSANGKYDEGEALWSWHIWVTDYDLSESATGEVGSPTGMFGHHRFMSHNIGAGVEHNLYTAPNTNMTLRFTQENSGNKVFVMISRPDIEENAYGNPFYQWGRKDPSVGLKGVNNKPMYDAEGENQAFVTYEPQISIGQTLGNLAATTIAHTVSSPRTWVYDNYGIYYYNLWSIDNTFCGESVLGMEVTKTVYDPSPYGYRMPNQNAFRYFTVSGEEAADPDGVNGEYQLDGQHGFRFRNSNGTLDANLFFPLSGLRFPEGLPANTGIQGRYWSAVPHSYCEGYTMYFYYTGYELNPLHYQFSTCGFSARPVLDIDINYMPNNGYPLDPYIGEGL